MGSLNWYTLGIDNTRCSMYGELAHDLVKNLKIRKQEDPTSVNLQGIIEKLSDPEIVELIASNSQYLYLVPEVKAEPKKDSPWYKEIQRIPGKLVVYDDSDYGPPAVRGISIAYPYIQSAPTKELAKTLREAFYGKSFGTRVSEGISGSIKKIKESLLHAA
ncbi:hypothetical protein J4206_06630 [Candidatus Woesearchaeota archaeon]|nr:hypothetical protein [Candidatus Woesearchaeota archaeon]